MNDLEAQIRRAHDTARPVEMADVHRVSRARRHRRILAAAAAVVVVVAASAAVLTRADARSSKVHVTVTGPTTLPAPGPTSQTHASTAAEQSTVTKGGITVRFVLDTPTVQVGGTLRGRLVVTTRAAIRGCPPSSFPLSVTNARTGHLVPGSDLPLCSGPAIPAGTTSYVIKQTATYPACSGTPETSKMPSCPPSLTGPPDLPTGRYTVAPALGLGDLSPELPTPPAVSLTIIAPHGPAASTTAVPAGWHQILYGQLGLALPRSWRIVSSGCPVLGSTLHLGSGDGPCGTDRLHAPAVTVTTASLPPGTTSTAGTINGVAVRLLDRSIYIPSIHVRIDPVGALGTRVARTLTVTDPRPASEAVTGTVLEELGGPSGRTRPPKTAATVALTAHNGTGPSYLAVTGPGGRFNLEIPAGTYTATSATCPPTPVTIQPSPSTSIPVTLVCGNPTNG